MRSNQGGLSMIEVLVAMVIIAVGILGLTALQLTAMKYNKEASLRSVATTLAVEIGDRMRSNTKGVTDGNYDRDMGYTTALTAVSAPSCGSSSDCSPSNMAKLDISGWQADLAAALPGGAGAIIPTAEASTRKSIVIMWTDKSLNDAGATDPACTAAPNTNAAVVGVRCFNTAFSL
jgi:type IV pilus assembly protein PilV